MTVLRAPSLASVIIVLGCASESTGPRTSPNDTMVASDVPIVADVQSEVPMDAATDARETVEGPEDVATLDVTAPPEVEADEDVATPDEVSSEPDAAPEPDVAAGPWTATVTLSTPDDAVSSYLMDAAAGAWNLFSGDTVPLGRHFGDGNPSYWTALRFVAVPVPAGATIVSATLTVSPTNEIDSNNPLWIDVWAERAGDSVAFDPMSTDSGRPDQRARTDAEIDHWLIRCNASCTDLTEFDCEQRKRDCWDREVRFTCPKDLAPLVQEVVSGEGWAAGNALTLLLVNAASDEDGAKYQNFRSITGVDPERGPAYSPTLEVTWK